MRGLKVLVIALGVLLIGGTVTLVGAMIWRGSHPVAAARSGAPPGRVPYQSVVELPAGAEIVSMHEAGERLVLELRLSDARRQLIVLDAASGARIGTIDLRAAP